MNNIKSQVKNYLEKMYYRNFDLLSVIQNWNKIKNINEIFDADNDLKLPEIKEKSPYIDHKVNQIQENDE